MAFLALTRLLSRRSILLAPPLLLAGQGIAGLVVRVPKSPPPERRRSAGGLGFFGFGCDVTGGENEGGEVRRRLHLLLVNLLRIPPPVMAVVAAPLAVAFVPPIRGSRVGHRRGRHAVVVPIACYRGPPSARFRGSRGRCARRSPLSRLRALAALRRRGGGHLCLQTTIHEGFLYTKRVDAAARVLFEQGWDASAPDVTLQRRDPRPQSNVAEPIGSCR
mmetsp:Transcript_15586/g.30780  ORF Transcript_15586/g.30780 Transcript_15586/m.30780 type:complete len:219 (+) Transcript_15586:387-1043(+)